MALDVAVVGLGYVGLPLAQEATRAGLAVLGFDASSAVVDGLKSGKSHVDDLSDVDIEQMLNDGFEPTTDPGRIADSKVAVICVPTPLSSDGLPDLAYVKSAAQTIAENLHQGMLVILESTTYPGTTDEVLRPILESNGLRAGDDFHLVFSPERIDPGNEKFGAKNTPKVVGGHTPKCADAAEEFYGKFIDTVVKTSGTREAETAKLLENTYRHINIALVNEMAQFCHELGIDLWDVIDAAKTKPLGFQAFYPGPGVGGHCIPIDPNYLSHNVRAKLGYPFRFVELAQEINATMPQYVVRRAQDILNDDSKSLRGSTVLLLGVTYKPNIADQRESPAVPIAKLLLNAGANVQFHDPFINEWDAMKGRVSRAGDVADAVQSADLTILLQDHSDYDINALAAASQEFFDTRGKTPRGDKVHRL